jgi:hypothetical protein
MTHQLTSIADERGRDTRGTAMNAEDRLRDRLWDRLRDRLRDRPRDPLGSAGSQGLCCSQAAFCGCSLCDISMPAGALL